MCTICVIRRRHTPLIFYFLLNVNPFEIHAPYIYLCYVHNMTVQSKKNIKKTRCFSFLKKNIHILIIIYLRGKGWSITTETNFYVSIYDNYAIINLVCVLFVFVFVRIPRKLNQFFLRNLSCQVKKQINHKQPAKREFTKSQYKFYNTNDV